MRTRFRFMLFVPFLLLVSAVTVCGQTVDMSLFSPATILDRAVTALQGDVPYLNEIELRSYVAAIDNWKLNKAQGSTAPIPDPPMAYELVVDKANFSVYVHRGTKPVCDKYVEPAPVPPPSKAEAIVPPFADGRYLCAQGDNAPAGWRIKAPDGVLVEKFITQSPFGPMPEYRRVQ